MTTPDRRSVPFFSQGYTRAVLPCSKLQTPEGPFVGERRVVQLPRLQTHPSKAMMHYVSNGVLGRCLAKSLQVLAGERNYRIPLTEEGYPPSIWGGRPLPPSAPLGEGRTWSAEGYSRIHPLNAFVNEILGPDFRLITPTATSRIVIVWPALLHSYLLTSVSHLFCHLVIAAGRKARPFSTALTS